MPAAILAEPQPASVPLLDDGPPRKKWTRAECEALEAAAILDPWQVERLELVEGELIDRMPKKRPHSNSTWTLCQWLVAIFGWDYIQMEVPIDVAPQDNETSEPEPDLVVLTSPVQTFRTANPQPEDLRLVVEVASSTLRFDCSVKAALYARAGIVEYWVLDVNGRGFLVHRDPRQGVYGSVIAYTENESVAPLAAPDTFCRVADVFPPAETAPAATVTEPRS